MKTQQKKQKGNVGLGLRFDDKPVVPFEADILVAEDFVRIYRSRPISHEHELMVGGSGRSPQRLSTMLQCS